MKKLSDYMATFLEKHGPLKLGVIFFFSSGIGAIVLLTVILMIL